MFHSPRFLLAFVATAVLGFGSLPAQDTDAAQVISAEEITRHVKLIADDSMQGRATPSRGLESTARYIADQFGQFGLKPLSMLKRPFDMGPIQFDTGYIQRYQLPFDFARSSVVFTVDPYRAVARFTTAARLDTRGPGWLSASPARTRVFLVTGTDTIEPESQQALRDQIILYVAPKAEGWRWRMISQLANLSRDVVVLTMENPDTFARQVRDVRAQYTDRPLLKTNKDGWLVHIRPEAVEGLQNVLTQVGVDVPQIRADTNWEVAIRELPSLRISFDAHAVEGNNEKTSTAPNVVGAIEGSDTGLKKEFVLISAHMDHLGVRHGETDSIANGTDDNASGTAGLIALAKAFSQPGAQPRRSVIFLATSGGARPGFWGSKAFMEKLAFQATIAAVVNLDMIGGTTPDSVTIDGLQAMELQPRLSGIMAAHTEPPLTVLDGVLNSKSEYAMLAAPLELREWQLIPTLGFHSGVPHDDRPAQEPAGIKADHAARVVRLAFHMSQAVANADRRPKWSAAGRRQLLDNGFLVEKP